MPLSHPASPPTHHAPPWLALQECIEARIRALEANLDARVVTVVNRASVEEVGRGVAGWLAQAGWMGGRVYPWPSPGAPCGPDEKRRLAASRVAAGLCTAQLVGAPWRTPASAADFPEISKALQNSLTASPPPHHHNEIWEGEVRMWRFCTGGAYAAV